MMKKLRLITLTAFAAICMSVSAQEPFATFYGQYNLSYLKSSHDSDSHKENFNEVTLGYNYATPLFSIPLYLEFGGAVQWAFKSEDEAKTNILALKAPVNLLFSINISDDFKILPYGGFYGRANLLAKTKPNESKSINWFKSDYFNAKRFQVGVNGGVKFMIGETVVIGAGYYRDLTDIADDIYFEGWDFTIGMVL